MLCRLVDAALANPRSRNLFEGLLAVKRELWYNRNRKE